MNTTKMSFALLTLCLFAVTTLSGCTGPGTQEGTTFNPDNDPESNCIDTNAQKGGCEEQLEEICFHKTSYFHKQCWENLESMLQELTPETPTNLRQTQCEGPKPNTVCLAWSASPSEVQSYLVYEHTAHENYTVAQVDGVNTSVILHNVPAGLHTYSVIAENDELRWNGTYHLLESNYSNEVDAYSFPAPPSGVNHFTLEVNQQDCENTANWFYAPPNGAGTIGLEWYMNTGNATIEITFMDNPFGADSGIGYRSVTSEGRWIPVGIYSFDYWFCFHNEEPVTIALALPPP